MALDIDKLNRAIGEYSHQLAKHQKELDAEFQQVNHLFAKLFAHYGGQQADELKRKWQQTANWFGEYQKATLSLNTHLTDRAKHLSSL